MWGGWGGGEREMEEAGECRGRDAVAAGSGGEGYDEEEDTGSCWLNGGTSSRFWTKSCEF